MGIQDYFLIVCPLVLAEIKCAFAGILGMVDAVVPLVYKEILP